MQIFTEKRALFKRSPIDNPESGFWRNLGAAREHDACGIGFAVTRKPTRDALKLALMGLCGMKDRTGRAFEQGDGAGVMFETASARTLWESFLPDQNVGHFKQLSVGMFFFEHGLGEDPKNQKNRVVEILRSHGIMVHGWRKVPTDDRVLPGHVRNTQPARWMLLYSPTPSLPKNTYRQQLFSAQQRIEREIKGAYPASLNPDTVTYKAVATPGQLVSLYAEDFNNQLLKVSQTIFHGRMATNTKVSDPNVQPGRILCHNGELATDRAQSSAQRDLEIRLGVSGEFEDCVTVTADGTDSRHFDGIIQALMIRDVTGPQALRRRILPARDDAYRYLPDERSHHELIRLTQGPLAGTHGPAAIVGMTGRRVFVVMDPLQLRTFSVYGNDEVIIGSSLPGEPPLPLEDIKFLYSMKGGEIGVVKPGEGFVLPDEVERRIVKHEREKFAMGGDATLLRLDHRPGDFEKMEKMLPVDVIKMWNHVGGEQYVMEVLRHMAARGKEPIEGMGDDRPLAVLSPGKLRTASYFAQIVAVVTNPPIDPIREGDCFDMRVNLGRAPKQTDSNRPGHYVASPQFKLDPPFMNPVQFKKMMEAKGKAPKRKVIDTSLEGMTGSDMQRRLDEIISEAVALAQADEIPIIVFSDRACQGSDRLFVPPVFIASAVDQALKDKGLRDNVSLVFDTMDAIEAHDMALLISQGADAVNPYLLWQMIVNDATGSWKDPKTKVKIETPVRQRLKNVQQSLDMSLKKIMAKMGIINFYGYRGSCLFEALGIDSEVSKKYLPNNVSRIGGLSFDDFASEQVARMKDRNSFRSVREATSRKGQIKTFLNDILLRQKFSNPEEAYQKLIEYIAQREPVFLRDLLDFAWAGERDGACEFSTDQVESVASIICRHFRGAQMSDGALGPVAHAAIAAAINELAEELMPGLGGDSDVADSERLDSRPKSGSGEGGEDPARYPGGELEEANSMSKQIASGRFGVDAYYIMSVGPDGELNIKIGQGAKPGQGGHVLGEKIYDRLARQRGTQPGVELISPPPQHDIYSIEDLMRLIWDLRAVNPEIKTVSVKVTTKAGIGTIALGIGKAGADKITLSGREGGTGAAESSATRYTGSPLELGIFEAFNMLRESGMVDKLRIEVDGGIITGTDVVKLAIMGADEFGFGTSLLQGGEGCILCNACAVNTCPVGICTSDAVAITRLALGAGAEKFFKDGGDPMTFAEQFTKCKGAVKHYWMLVAQDVQRILAKLGLKTLEELRGRYDLLKRIKKNPESDRVDLNFLWDESVKPEDVPNFGDMPIAPKNPVSAVNEKMVKAVELYVPEEGGRFEMEIELSGMAGLDLDAITDVRQLDNCHDLRTIGATLAGKIAAEKLPKTDGDYNFTFKGYAGQSFGFCNVDGINLRLEGIARDFVGSAMSGGKIVVVPPENLRSADKAVSLAGGTCAYGARGGKLFIAGEVGQRFGVRSCLGATLACEGAGKYAFEYMTGGIGLVIGDIGNQVGSGMSDGELFIWNEEGNLDSKLHKDSVKIVKMRKRDEVRLKALLEEYCSDTQSPRAKAILDDWESKKNCFSRVVSKYKPKKIEPSAEGVERIKKMGGFPLPVVRP